MQDSTTRPTTPNTPVPPAPADAQAASPQTSPQTSPQSTNQPASDPSPSIEQQLLMAEQRGYMRALGINPEATESAPTLLSSFNPGSFWD